MNVDIRQLIDDVVFGHLKTRTEGINVSLPLYDVMLIWLAVSTLTEIAKKNGVELTKTDTQFKELMELNDKLKVMLDQHLKLALLSPKNPN